MNWLARKPLKALLLLFAATALAMGLSLAGLGLLHHLNSMQRIDAIQNHALVPILKLSRAQSLTLALPQRLGAILLKPDADLRARQLTILHNELRQINALLTEYSSTHQLPEGRPIEIQLRHDLKQLEQTLIPVATAAVSEGAKDPNTALQHIDTAMTLAAPVNQSIERLIGLQRVQISRKANEARAWLSNNALFSTLILSLGLAASLALLTILIPRFVRPFAQISRSMARMAQGHPIRHLDIPAQSHQELQQLSDSFNQLLEHVEVRENALRIERDQFHSLSYSLPDGLFLLDADGHVRQCNPAAARLLQASTPDALQGASFARFFEDNEPGDILVHFSRDAAPEDPSGQREASLLRPDGALLPVLVTAAPIHDAHAAFTGFVVTIKDLSELAAYKERQRNEMMMLSQSRLSALGEVATGVAHEINQPLTFISATVQSIRRGIRREKLDPAHSLELLEESMRQIHRISNIIDHMRTFGRADMAHKTEAVDVPTVINNALILIGARLRNHNIVLAIEGAEGLPEVSANSSEMEQVFINLFTNTMDAFADTPQDRRKITITLAQTGDQVHIVFADSGPGIPAEVLERIFEPFFTTKPVGKGTGLGLSLILGIVQKYNGHIHCESSPDAGTRFIIQLPVRAEAQAE